MTLPYHNEPDQRFWDKVVSWVGAAPPASEPQPPTQTHLLILLDRSGSMDILRDDTIGGFNAFLAEQQAVPGSATLTLVQFDGQNPYERVYEDQPLDAVPPLTRATFVPRSGTPLLDALGQGLLDLEQRLADRPAHAQPSSVIIAILTDGQENASHRFRKPQIVSMIREKQTTAGWQFIFLSADLDAVQDARQLGFHDDTVMAFDRDARGMTEAWTTLSDSVTAYRTGDRPHRPRLRRRSAKESVDHRVFLSTAAANAAFHDPQQAVPQERRASLQLLYRNHVFTLGPSDTVFCIGRSLENDLMIDAPRVSRRHLQLAFVDAQWVLYDFSTNGTYLGSAQDDPRRVHQQEWIVRGRGVMALGQAPGAENPEVIHYQRGDADASAASSSRPAETAVAF